MATSPAAVLDPLSLDAAGLSVATASLSGSHPRAGAIYDPLLLAAAAPVCFHPMPGGSHLMVTSRHWTEATPDGGLPGVYSDYTEDLTPSWWVVHGRTGARGVVPGHPGPIPVHTATESLTLVAGASRATDYLYLLHAATIATDPAALLQHLRIAPTGEVSIYAEEVLPTVTMGEGEEEETIVFDRGLQHVAPYLLLYGSNAAGQLFRMRRSWARVGVNHRLSPDETGWEYFTGTGYSTDPTQIAVVPKLTTVGPLGFAVYKGIVLVSTVVEGPSGVYTGKIWQSQLGRPVRLTTTSVALGEDSDGSYLNTGLLLQPALAPNPVAEAMTGMSGGVLWLVSKKATVAEGDSLVNTWGLHTF